MSKLIIALISAATSVVVTLLAQWLTARNRRRQKRLDEQRLVLHTYIYPLRFALEQAYFRNAKLLESIERGDPESLAWLQFAETGAAMAARPDAWFNENKSGYYHVSSCYIAACLFHRMGRLRAELPYVALSAEDDAQLIGLMYAVTYSFLADEGVYHILQDSMGVDLYLADLQRIRNYREYCQLLKQPNTADWHNKLLDFYAQAGRGERTAQLREIVASIARLLTHIETLLGARSTAATDRWVVDRSFVDRPLDPP